MGGGGSQNQTTKTEPWAGQQPYLTKGFQEAEDLYDSGPQKFYPGQNYTDMSPARTSGLFGSLGLAGSGSNPADAAATYANQTLSGNDPYAQITGLMDTASGSMLAANPYLDDVYNSAADKVTDEWSSVIMPGIASSFGMSGGAGTTMANEMAARSGGELSDTLAKLKADIYGGNYQQERDRQVGAQTSMFNTGTAARTNLANNAANIRAGQYGDFDKMGEVGRQFEEQQGKEIQADIDRWNFDQNAPYAALQDYMSMISGNFGSTSTTRGGSSGSGLSTGLGAVLGIASMFSDVRLKCGIRHIATTDDGIKLYAFRYTRDARQRFGLPPGVQIGVIAQEVQPKYRALVSKDRSGYLKVDYGRLFKQRADVREVFVEAA